MKLKNDNIRLRILTVARQEFLAEGFRQTSMRNIASKAGVNLSNIYNYFDSKDAILVCILRPMLIQLEQHIQSHHNEDLSLEQLFDQNRTLDRLKLFVDLINLFREELFILFNRVDGSSFEYYIANHIEIFSAGTMQLAQRSLASYTDSSISISPYFLRITSKFFVDMLKEIASNPTMSDEKIYAFVEEYIIFCTAGWQGLAKKKGFLLE